MPIASQLVPQAFMPMRRAMWCVHNNRQMAALHVAHHTARNVCRHMPDSTLSCASSLSYANGPAYDCKSVKTAVSNPATHRVCLDLWQVHRVIGALHHPVLVSNGLASPHLRAILSTRAEPGLPVSNKGVDCIVLRAHGHKVSTTFPRLSLVRWLRKFSQGQDRSPLVLMGTGPLSIRGMQQMIMVVYCARSAHEIL